MKKIFFSILAVIFLSQLSFSQVYDTIPQSITGNTTLTNNKIWVIKGFTRVQAGGTLTIQAGTLVYGYKVGTSVVSALIVEMGGKLIADGTASQPIIFTSSNAPGTRTIGDWGGVVVCGRSRINTVNGTDTSQIVEGSIGSLYGGTNDADNSGIIRYVRIEYAGANLSGQSGNELNSLTMGGVGSGTVIEYVQVSYGFDDGFEWFGGTVNCKYLISYKVTDDDFDVDNGFRGKVQFGLVVKDKNIADQSGSHAIESDNNPNSPNNYNGPRTKPVFSNITFIGPKQDTNTIVNPDHKRGYHLRRNSLTSVYNSIVMGFPDAILFDGAGVTCAAQNDTMQHRNNIFGGNPGMYKSTSAGCNFNANTWVNSAPFNNRTYSANSQVQLFAPFGDSSTINPAPVAGSPALTGADFTNPNLAGFIPTTYVGAFALNTLDNVQWMSGWASFTPQSNAYVIGIEPISNIVPKTYSLQQNYPNPFNPTTNIKFDVASTGFTKLVIFDVIGRVVATLVNEELKAGQYAVNYNAASLPSGVYLYRLTVENSNSTFTDTKKLVLVK